MPMMFAGAKPADHPIIFVNQAFLDLTGYEEHEVMGQSLFALLEHSSDPEMLAEIHTAFGGGRDLQSLVRYRHKDGRVLWVTLNIAPVQVAHGEVVQFFASFMNVTIYKKKIGFGASCICSTNRSKNSEVGSYQISRRCG